MMVNVTGSSNIAVMTTWFILPTAQVRSEILGVECLMPGHKWEAGLGFECWALQTRAFPTSSSRGFRGYKANPKTCTHKMDKEGA